jgi:pimeloyl-ACP methyl ester carboxylesterase
VPLVISKDGARIHYAAHGGGRPVVLLHPNRATSASWQALGWLDALARAGLRAIALHARGFGASEPVGSAAQLRPGSSSEDLAAVLDALGIEAAWLCGYSLGAAHALRFAVDHPARVHALVLGGLALGPLVQCGLAASADPDADRRQALAELERPLAKAIGPERAYFEAVREVIATAPLRALGAARLPLPVLAIAGQRDRVGRGAIEAALRGTGARLAVRTLEAADHGGAFVHPEFRSAAIEFLARDPRPTERRRAATEEGEEGGAGEPPRPSRRQRRAGS